jgi:hypothetical protein
MTEQNPTGPSEKGVHVADHVKTRGLAPAGVQVSAQAQGARLPIKADP